MEIVVNNSIKTVQISKNTVVGSSLESIDIPVKMFTFSGGEEYVKIDHTVLYANITQSSQLIIYADIKSSRDLMQLIMLKNALDNMLPLLYKIPITLVMLYVPYARQDRICEEGEAFSLKQFGSLLNSLKFDQVLVADPHSDVTGAVIENLKVIPQEDIITTMLQWYIVKENFALVSPDAGALKKIYKVSKELNNVDVFCAEKVRDTQTGKILKTDINVQDFSGRNLMIVDDIADGGATFMFLAKLLKERNAGRVDLYVTHGIFAKGVNPLASVIDKVHSFNVWEDNLEEDQKILIRNQFIVQSLVLSKYLEGKL